MKTNIVLVSNTCSNEYYLLLQSIKFAEKVNPSQKFFDMFVKGLNTIDECSVTCVSIRSIDPSNCHEKKLDEYKETVNGVEYLYPKVINRKIRKHFVNIRSCKKICKDIVKNNKSQGVETIFLTDFLSFDASYSVLRAVGKDCHKCTIVTDIPSDVVSIGKGSKIKIKSKIKAMIHNKLLSKYDSYCFLTESMNEYNRLHKPYIVIEGMTDSNINYTYMPISKKVVLYAGGLHDKFGIKNLVDASSQIDIQGFELHLYGEGNTVQYINECQKKHPNIMYMGVKSFDEMFEKEREAYLLINPRPVGENFTKYSFPSKTLEYLSTGRPVLSTRLAGIPNEYFNYLFSIDNDSVEGIKQSLERVLSLEPSFLEERGRQGFDFVKSKSCEKQSLKLWKFLKNAKRED